MANSESVNLNTDVIDTEIAYETLENIIVEAIITICHKKKTDVSSIFEYLKKDLHNSNITSILIDARLSTLTVDGKLEIKYPLGKATYWVKDNNALASCKSNSPMSSPSLPSPLNSETPVIELNKNTVRDTYRSLEKKVNLLNIKIIALKY